MPQKCPKRKKKKKPNGKEREKENKGWNNVGLDSSFEICQVKNYLYTLWCGVVFDTVYTFMILKLLHENRF